MKRLNIGSWTKIALFNFLLVSLLGVVMRYKIGFEFPFLNQKSLQHSHSHFAFGGWVSLLIMVLMVKVIESRISEKAQKDYRRLFIAFLIVAYGSLVSFILQGYGPVSITFSVLSILLSYLFAIMFFRSIKGMNDLKAKKWFIAGLLFSIISALGTFYLSYMMATKNINQNAYLGSVYWYLHFQYNGWFFFACAGLFVQYLQKKSSIPSSENFIFWLFALTCVPGYGLSVLWLDLPIWMFVLVCIAAIVQFYAIIRFLVDFKSFKPFTTLQWNRLTKFLLIFVGFSLFTKLLLQLGSTVPAIAKFAFGFRPIVIAYLHLVLLGFTSLFLVVYIYMNQILYFGKWATRGIFWLSIGVFLNELVLAAQGVGSLSYTLIPYANEMLFFIALFILVSLIFVNSSKTKRIQ
jgi:hypothetical protein